MPIAAGFSHLGGSVSASGDEGSFIRLPFGAASGGCLAWHDSGDII